MRKLNPILGFIIFQFIFFSCQKEISLQSSSSSQSLTPVQMSQPDQGTVDFIQPYKAKLDKEMNKVIGTCPEELLEADYQSPLGNFIIDLIRYQSEKHFKKDIDLAVVTNGGLRTPMPKGDVTVGNIFELMPFNNEVVVLEMDAETTRKLFQYAAKGRNAVIAGATFEVQNAAPLNVLVNGRPIEEGRIYTLAVSDYLAGGGDKMSFLKDAQKTHQLGVLFRDQIIDHIKELTAGGKEITGSVDNRVIIKDE